MLHFLREKLTRLLNSALRLWCPTPMMASENNGSPLEGNNFTYVSNKQSGKRARTYGI